MSYRPEGMSANHLLTNSVTEIVEELELTLTEEETLDLTLEEEEILELTLECDSNE